MKQYLSAFFFGLMFSGGLGISGMMNPQKVQGFLDLFGRWDPSLALVMGGAVMMTLIFYPLVFKRKKPILGEQFNVPTNKKIDAPLLGGAVLFGMGWAISGLCPGPALANTATLNPGVLVYLAAMLAGFWLFRTVSLHRIRRHSEPVKAAQDAKEFCADQCVID